MSAPAKAEPMTEKRFERWLGGLILRSSDRVRGVVTFESAEILSLNYRLVVEMKTGPSSG